MKYMIYNMNNQFTDHPQQTRSPQTYVKHGMFAIINSFRLIVAGFAGVIHGFIPSVFPFYTSGVVIQSFQKLLKSGRHDNEVLSLFRENLANEQVLVIKSDNKAPNCLSVKNLQLTIKLEEI